jgi:predicted  nucleic acid-binding Zn-ribbon protein
MSDESVTDDVTTDAVVETPEAVAAVEDAAPDLAKNPEAMADLLKQLNDASKTIKDLQNKTSTYEKEKANATRAQQTREQQLESDLTEAQKIIEKMDSVIRHTAIVNAIQGMKDYEFHSARHVLNELDPNSFDVDVDLENGTATISGIDGEIKRVAKEMPWLVAQSKGGNTIGQRTPVPRSSGAPPGNPNGDADKVSRRAELMKKFPVISHGRAGK